MPLGVTIVDAFNNPTGLVTTGSTAVGGTPPANEAPVAIGGTVRTSAGTAQAAGTRTAAYFGPYGDLRISVIGGNGDGPAHVIASVGTLTAVSIAVPALTVAAVSYVTGGGLQHLQVGDAFSTTTGRGGSAVSNVTVATVVKGTAGRVGRVSVITAGSTVGTVNNAATTGTAAAANQVATIPNTIGTYDIDFPCSTGIVAVPGTGQVLAISFG